MWNAAISGFASGFLSGAINTCNASPEAENLAGPTPDLNNNITPAQDTPSETLEAAREAHLERALHYQNGVYEAILNDDGPAAFNRGICAAVEHNRAQNGDPIDPNSLGERRYQIEREMNESGDSGCIIA